MRTSRIGRFLEGRGSSLALAAGVGGAVLVASACGAPASQGEEDGELRGAERTIIGRAAPYEADATLIARDRELAGSQRARREVAWAALAKILKQVPLAEGRVVNADGTTPTIPAFRTWYQKDDIERMFGRLFEAHGSEARRARAPFGASAVDEAIDWNAGDRGSWSEEQYFERVRQVDGSNAVQGLGGNSRVQYSAGLVRHLLKQWSPLAKCAGDVDDPLSAEPTSATNFTTCFDEEAPLDAALIKASWSRADFGMKLGYRSTSAEALKARIDGTKDKGGWGSTTGEAAPTPDQVYTVSLSDRSKWRLPAMHLVTKELRHWLWISIWWSPEPDTDFGADRPESITALGGPWKNYKMCVVSDYAEGDPDPTGGYPTGPGSLGDALAAVHVAGGPSWCSNHYIERGDKNAQTNCIGCHQHAGTPLGSAEVLENEEKFPRAGRTQVRKRFPADYMFAATSAPEGIATILQSHVAHFEQIDR